MSNILCIALFPPPPPQVSRDGEIFLVPLQVAKVSKLIVDTLGMDDDDEIQDMTINIPNVKSSVLRKVIQYCTHYVTVEEMTPIETPLKSARLGELVQEWYAEFCNVAVEEQSMLFGLVTAANYMDIKPLLDLTCLAVSVLIKGKSAVEIRSIFHLTNELSPEERRQVEAENEWCDKPV